MITEYKINWAVPGNIGYFISTNETGNSKGRYKYANFSNQVGDDTKNVESNINELKTLHGLNNIKKGNMSTLNSPEEVHLAEKLLEINEWADMVRFARTGGEANAIAIRIARAASSKSKVAICGYHGSAEFLNINIPLSMCKSTLAG